MFVSQFLKSATIILLTTLFCACGFHPIYQKDNQISKQSQSYSQELAAIKILIPRNKLNQDLKNNLEKILNPTDIKTDPKYLLSITLNKTLTSTFITATGSSGRNKVILVATYTLKDLNTDKTIATSTVTVKDDFDVEGKRFANYVTEEAIASNLTLIIAKDIRNLIVNDIVNNYKSERKKD